ncbi:hypothetical protein NHX12_005050 [Muraenolepis orangiensis]|uniref:Uncharacterized protein n=1 Tax=Muraenolepis orangiensis TaxID=630683 RepID=A0A9Q0IFM8_9TELE|nr:hypothetical protein NHX12_004515 [Muraenolepis orangiensis]KAJ3595747.1 hypothetical protein NHX12_005050 [Muraenolepis orangiensis]
MENMSAEVAMMFIRNCSNPDLSSVFKCTPISKWWTIRTPAIRSVLMQYESVLMALEEMASCSSPETSAKAKGLHGTLLKGNTRLGLVVET